MPKRGQHHNDHRDSDVPRGHNLYRKNTPMTTGSYKTGDVRAAEIRRGANLYAGPVREERVARGYVPPAIAGRCDWAQAQR
jgi:hypothetical protein